MNKHHWLWVSIFFIVWRIGLGFLAVSADQALDYKPSFPYARELLAEYGWPRWFYSWANFDGVHYITIAEKGYVGTGLIQAFFPVFPVLLSAVTILVDDTVLAGLLVSNLWAYLLVLTWFSFIKVRSSVRTAWIATALLLLFPTSFYWGAVYSEALFLCLVLWSFEAARRHQWWIAGGLAAIASATRVVGIALLPALMVELWYELHVQHRQPITSWWSHGWWLLRKSFGPHIIHTLFIGLAVVGLGSYMLYLWREFRDPLYFLHVQSEFGSGRQETLILYPQVVWRYLKIVVTYRPFDWHYWAFFQEAVVGVGGALGLLGATRAMRPGYMVYAWSAFLIPTMTGTFSSMPRYILVCFPLWMWLAYYLRSKPWVLACTLLCSSIGLCINTVLFIQGYWVA